MTLAQVLRREAVAVTQADGEIDFPERFQVALQHSDLGPEGRRS